MFDRQADVAIENLERLHAAIGDRAAVIQTNGTDFGTQNGPFCSPAAYRGCIFPTRRG